MGKRRERTGIVLLNDHMKLAHRLVPDEEIKALYEAVRVYSMENRLVDLDGRSEAMRGIFEMICSAQDENRRKYDETCERNRAISMKRVEREQTLRLAADAAKQNKTKENKTKEDKTKETLCADAPSLEGQEGVTSDESGFVWW